MWLFGNAQIRLRKILFVSVCCSDVDVDESSFEQVEFPPQLPTKLHLDKKNSHSHDRAAAAPITKEVLFELLDCDGRLVDEHRLRQMTFLGMTLHSYNCLED